MRGDRSVLLYVVCFISGLVMGIVVPETFWAYKKYKKIISVI